MRMNPARAALAVPLATPWQRASGVAETRIYLASSDNAQRNSANDATDTAEVNLASVVVAPNNGAKRGTLFEIWSLWETSNSANIKNGIARINGNSIGNPMQIGAGIQSQTQRQPFNWQDANNLVTLNNGVSTGAGQSATLLLVANVPSMASAGFTVVFSCSWSAQPIAGEFIRLKQARIVQVNP